MRKAPKVMLLVLALVLPFGFPALSFQARDNPWNLQVFDSSGKPVELKKLAAGNDLTVLLFLGADCPLSNKAITEAAEDLEKIKTLGKVGLFGLLCARDDAEDIKRMISDFKASFPLHLDRDNQVAGKLGIEVVPTAILLNNDGKILYQGRINDRVEQLGKRAKARRHDLLEALNDALKGNPVRVARTEVAGCPLETRKATPNTKGRVEYHRDIQPFLYSHCVVCHQEKGVAPFSLAEYNDATLWMETSIGMIETKTMPPAQAESHFAIEELIPKPTAAELNLLKSWVAEGMPQGTRPEKPLELPPTDPEAGKLGKPDMILRPEGPMTIAPVGDDLYRFLVFKMNLDREVKIQAVKMIPGNKKVVHHSLILFGDSNELSKISSDKDLISAGLLPGDKGPGYGQGLKLGKYLRPEKNSARHGFEMVGGYAPGAGSYKSPKGYAITIPPKSDFVVQMHYHRTGKVETDFSSIELYFAKGEINPNKEYRTSNINDENFFMMPPNQRKHTSYEWSAEEDLQIASISPHGHYLTLSQNLTLELPDGTVQTLVNVPKYDFNWQRLYTFREPVWVPKGSKVRVSSLLDNTSANPHNPHKPPRPVFMGENTTDEMVFPFISIIIDKDSKMDLQRSINSIYRNANTIEFLKRVLDYETPDEPDPIKKTSGNKP